MIWLLIGVAVAANVERRDWQWTPNRDPNRLVIKFHEASGWASDRLPEMLLVHQTAIQPVFSEDVSDLRQHFSIMRKSTNVEDLTTYIEVSMSKTELDDLATSLEHHPDIEHLYRAFLPQEPPMDIPPETPDFTGDQWDHQSIPNGLGFSSIHDWVGGDAVRVANIEYSYEPLHEDLVDAAVTYAWGWDSGDYAFHGNAVIGQMVAVDNGYGVIGAIPDAEILVMSPYETSERYSVGDAILSAADLLVSGDVILIEQQTARANAYCPMEYVPSVFDAIQWVTAQGIIVVEPGANGAQDLDTSVWDGWFDLDVQDSGAIMVGGSQANIEPLMWVGSSFGSRIDVQGWYQDITTTSADQYGDLFFPNADSLQAYTQYFGGTSGASPQIVSMIVSINSMRIQMGEAPYTSTQIREIVRQSGRSQPFVDQDRWIGNQPDVETLIRMWAW